MRRVYAAAALLCMVYGYAVAASLAVRVIVEIAR